MNMYELLSFISGSHAIYLCKNYDYLLAWDGDRKTYVIPSDGVGPMCTLSGEPYKDSKAALEEFARLDTSEDDGLWKVVDED